MQFFSRIIGHITVSLVEKESSYDELTSCFWTTD